ncbi:MAG TPA: SDR family oxidoreductase [Patescibacteria group bacterium]|nr:SDR family oxidoreductase [Patescibacteria group bacterium]
MAIKKILVTGSEGYIGSVLIQRLLDEGYEVVGVDTKYFQETRIGPHPTYQLLEKDVRKITATDLEGVDAVIHLAALSNDALGELESKLTRTINFKATKRLALLSKKAGVKRFLFSSSCSIYGIADDDIVDETSKVNPLTEYAKSKIASEQALQELADRSFCVVSLRNATVYGFSPAFRNDLVVNNFTTCALALGEIRIESDGTPWRPLIDVRDLSNIFLHFLEIDSRKVNKQIINIGFPENNFQVNELVKIVHQKLPSTKISYTGNQPDSRSYKVNFQKFQGISPSLKQEWDMERSVVDLITGLKKINFSRDDFINKKYARLTILKKKLRNKELTAHLYWKRVF